MAGNRHSWHKAITAHRDLAQILTYLHAELCDCLFSFGDVVVVVLLLTTHTVGV